MTFSQEDVCIWFKNLESHSRIELICTLFDKCVPLELRFLGTYLEYYAGKHYTHLQKFEKDANNNENLNNLNDLFDRQTRRLLCIFLALLHSHNRLAATKLYEVLKSFKQTETPVQKIDTEKDTTPEKMEKSISLENEIRLLLTMASYHPAFEFLQRQTMREKLASLKNTSHLSNEKLKYSKHNQSAETVDTQVFFIGIHCKTEQPLQGMELQDKEAKKMKVQTDPVDDCGPLQKIESPDIQVISKASPAMQTKSPLLPSPVVPQVQYFLEKFPYGPPIMHNQPRLLPRAPMQHLNQPKGPNNTIIPQHELPNHIVHNIHEHIDLTVPFQPSVSLKNNMLPGSQFATNNLRPKSIDTAVYPQHLNENPSHSISDANIVPQPPFDSAKYKGTGETSNINSSISATLRDFPFNNIRNVMQPSPSNMSPTFRRCYSESEAANRNIQLLENVVLTPVISENGTSRPVIFPGNDNFAKITNEPYTVQGPPTYIANSVQSVASFHTVSVQNSQSFRSITVPSSGGLRTTSVQQSLKTFQTPTTIADRTFLPNQNKVMGMPYIPDLSGNQNIHILPTFSLEKDMITSSKNNFVPKLPSNFDHINQLNHTHIVPIPCTGINFMYPKDGMVSPALITKVTDGVISEKQTIPTGKNGGYINISQPLLVPELLTVAPTELGLSGKINDAKYIEDKNNLQNKMLEIPYGNHIPHAMVDPPSPIVNNTDTSDSPYPSPSTSPKPFYSPNHSPMTQRRSSRENANIFGSATNWLKSLRLHKYEDKFKDFTFEKMSELTDDKLSALGLTLGARTKLLQQIEVLKNRGFKEFGQPMNNLTTDSLLSPACQYLEVSPAKNISRSNDVITTSLNNDISLETWTTNNMTLVTVTTVSTYTNLVIPPNNEGQVVPHEYALNANLTQVPVVDKAGSRVPDLLPGHTYPLEGNPLITTGPTLVNTTEEINRHLESTEDEVFEKSSPRSRRSSLLVTCYNCGAAGHYGDECTDLTMEAQTYSRYGMYEYLPSRDLLV